MNKKGRHLRQVIALLLVLCMAAMYPATALAAETAPVEKAAEEVTSIETTATTAAIEEAAATTAPTEATAPVEITVIASGEGDTYAWTLTSDGKLTISGTKIPDWSYSTQAPWRVYSNDITAVVIEPGVENIGDLAFYSCDSLMAITIPSSVTVIGRSAFAGCIGLSAITIPAGVITIGDSAFYRCTGLKAITVAAENENYCSVDGILYNKNMTELIAAPGGYIGDITIPDSVTAIDGEALDSPGLTAITVAAGNKSYCSVDGVLYDKPVTEIVKVPLGISGSVTIPEGVTEFGGLTGGVYTGFQGCTGLTEITIPASVTSILFVPFHDCTGLKAITVAAENENYCSVDGILYNKNTTELIAAPEGYVGNITIPSSVTTIEMYAFVDCTSVTEITIPASVTTIGDGAFYDCTGLTSVFFLGDAPEISTERGSPFNGVTASAYYPAGNATWTEEVLTADYTGGNGTITWIPWYPVISGDGSTVSEGDGQSLSFRMEAPFDQFQKVEIDGVLLDPAYYDVRGGEGTLSTRAAESTSEIVLHSDYLATLTPGEHTLTAHFTTGVAFANFTVEGDKMTAGSLTLEGDIGVNFYMRLTEKTLADTGAKLVFTVNGKTTEIPVSQGTSTANGCRFTCKVAAKQMNDTITAQIVRSDGTVSKVYSYSVRTYFENRLKAANVTPEMKAMAEAMLNYGAAAQTYFGYDTEHLANRDLNTAAVTMLDAGALESYKATVTYTDKNTAGITVRYGTLVLESTTIVRAYFQLAEGEKITDYRFTVNGKEVTPTKKGEQYVVDSEGIVAKRLNENCAIVVEKDGAVVLTMHYGAWSYAYSKLSSASASETLKLLVSALYAYHQAASAYFAK